MELARYVVDAVILEGRSSREVARAHGVSKSWVAKLYEGLWGEADPLPAGQKAAQTRKASAKKATSARRKSTRSR
jgi:transposase